MPDPLVCLLRNLHVGQEGTVRTLYGTTDWFKIERGVRLFIVIWNVRLDESQAGIKIAERNISNLRYAGTTLMAESEEKLKSPLIWWRAEWKSWLKTQHSKHEDHGIWSHHFKAKRWGNSGHSGGLYFLGLQNHCGWWLQSWSQKLIASWQESYNKDSVLKSKDITLPIKVHIFKVMVFPVVMYGCESWTIKKAECWRIDTFELWCWRRLLIVPWTATF